MSLLPPETLIAARCSRKMYGKESGDRHTESICAFTDSRYVSQISKCTNAFREGNTFLDVDFSPFLLAEDELASVADVDLARFRGCDPVAVEVEDRIVVPVCRCDVAYGGRAAHFQFAVRAGYVHLVGRQDGTVRYHYAEGTLAHVYAAEIGYKQPAVNVGVDPRSDFLDECFLAIDFIQLYFGVFAEFYGTVVCECHFAQDRGVVGVEAAPCIGEGCERVGVISAEIHRHFRVGDVGAVN